MARSSSPTEAERRSSSALRSRQRIMGALRRGAWENKERAKTVRQGLSAGESALPAGDGAPVCHREIEGEEAYQVWRLVARRLRIRSAPPAGALQLSAALDLDPLDLGELLLEQLLRVVAHLLEVRVLSLDREPRDSVPHRRDLHLGGPRL